MKRIILCLLTLSLGLCVTANDDPHLKRLIECINDSDFVCATEELPQVENWKPIKTWLTIYNALTFLKQVDSIDIEKQQLDSFRLYMAHESSSYRRKYFKKGKYNQALTCLLYTSDAADEVLGCGADSVA